MPIEPTPSGNESIIGIPDPKNTSIYRIFPLWFFEELLRLKQLVLVPPRLWEDPFEILASNIMMVDQRTKPWKQQLLDSYLKPAYAQCWSKTEESDTLLRAYSRVVKDPHFGRNIDPRQEGAQVRTSVTRLIDAAQD